MTKIIIEIILDLLLFGLLYGMSYAKDTKNIIRYGVMAIIVAIMLAM